MAEHTDMRGSASLQGGGREQEPSSIVIMTVVYCTWSESGVKE